MGSVSRLSGQCWEVVYRALGGCLESVGRLYGQYWEVDWRV